LIGMRKEPVIHTETEISQEQRESLRIGGIRSVPRSVLRPVMPDQRSSPTSLSAGRYLVLALALLGVLVLLIWQVASR
jgi:hypothetical protein